MASNLILFAAFVFSMFLMSLNYKRKRQKIVFFGDLITEQGAKPGGFITRILQKFIEEGIEAKYELTCAGISGNKVYDLYTRLNQDVLAKGADVVVIFIGINDVWHKNEKLTENDFTEFKKCYVAIIQKLRSVSIKVVLCTPTVIGENKRPPGEADNDVELLSNLIKALAEEYELPFVNLRTALVNYLLENNLNDNYEGILTVDGVHLNKMGNQLVADEMFEVLRQI